MLSVAARWRVLAGEVIFAMLEPALPFRSFPRKVWAGRPASVRRVSCCDEEGVVTTSGVANSGGIGVGSGRLSTPRLSQLTGCGNSGAIPCTSPWVGGISLAAVRAFSMSLSLSLKVLWLVCTHLSTEDTMLSRK